MKRAVVLAAGTGQRLGPATNGLPKPLVPLHGVPLIDYTLAALAAAGVNEVVVVIGYRGEEIRAYLEGRPGFAFAANERYLRGASYSLQAARPFCGNEPFLLVMADHVLSADLLERLARAGRTRPPGTSLVAADRGTGFNRSYLEEATRVAITPGSDRVAAIGKQLDPYSGIDCGAFACDAAIWRCVDAAPEDSDLSTIFRLAAAQGDLFAVDVSGCAWYDVDTEADLREAERRFTPGARGRALHPS